MCDNSNMPRAGSVRSNFISTADRKCGMSHVCQKCYSILHAMMHARGQCPCAVLLSGPVHVHRGDAKNIDVRPWT